MIIRTSYAPCMIARTQSVCNKLTAELDIEGLTIPAPYRDATKLPYLDAVIREAMRLALGAGLLIERIMLGQGLTLSDGGFIPAGTRVGLDPGVINLNSAVFGPDVFAYNHDRWPQARSESDDYQVCTVLLECLVQILHTLEDWLASNTYKACACLGVAKDFYDNQVIHLPP